MAGAAVGPGIVVDCSPLKMIGALDGHARTVNAQPGALCSAVDAAARREGLRFPVDPSSARFCTIGGMASTNAAGAHTLRFGPMRAWVSALDCVFADGSRGWIRRDGSVPGLPPLARFASLAPALARAERAAPARHAGVRKESSGFGLADWAASGSLVDLLVGSEGTLAFFVGLELKLAPLPEASATVLAAFPSIDAAAAGSTVAAELNAGACELLDRTFLEIARRGGPLPVPDNTDAVLLVEIEESTQERLREMVRALSTAFGDAGAGYVETALDATRASQLWHLRHAASPILASLARATVSMQVIEDGAVPPARLPDYVRGVRAAFDRHGIGGVLFGHAGDGHLHANALVDASVSGWRERVHDLFNEVLELTVSLGGTMSGEHGDGRLRAGVLSRVWPAEVVERFRSVKDAFDPDGILNPGVKFPAAGSPAFGAPIKYDPALEPLPREAQRALDRVQRDRCWDRFRLSLLEDEASR
jgi:FAD/FMN-containing dehydrogenase